MPKLSPNVEFADIHYIYGYCDRNAEAVAKEYKRQFPSWRCPDTQSFSLYIVVLKNTV